VLALDRLRPNRLHWHLSWVSQRPSPLPTSARESCPRKTEVFPLKRRCETTLLFRLQGFSPSWRLTPREPSQACCILLPALGFITFCVPRTRSYQAPSRHTPRDATHTLQSVPLSCSRTLSPGPLPSRCWLPKVLPLSLAPTSRLCSPQESPLRPPSVAT